MNGTFDPLLDATIRHLETLRERGVGHVNVSAETLKALRLPASRAGGNLPPAKPEAASPRITVRPEREPAPAIQTASPTPTAPPARFQAAPAAVEKPANPITDIPDTQPMPSSKAQKTKAAAILALQQKALACTRCAHLAASRTQVVFGVGNPDARLMLVGEAPGADEDEQGEPFVGRAGQLLTKIIRATGLDRGDIYIANILKCRPDTPGQGSGNRKPRPEEMETCLPYLHSQIDIIKPGVLVALGTVAVEGLMGPGDVISNLRGKWLTYRGIPLMPTFHPAYLLRNQSLSIKRAVWEDFLQVMEKLEMPISKRQRQFFLNA